jgi:uncharacterized membrane protein
MTSALDALPVDRLKSAGQDLLKMLVDRAVSAALDQVDGLTDRLGDVAENGGAGLSGVLGGGGSDGSGDSGGGIGGALSSAASAIKDRASGALGSVIPGLGGGDDEDSEGAGGSGGGGSAASKGARGKFKFMNIFEVQDVGVPLRVAYDQWTQFADFPSFMKKVENVDQSADEKITWHAKVFWSKRSWDTTIVEQIPDSHILWTSSGQKGRADGIVTFSELAPNLTRIVLILEYYPQGLFEKTGNIWRAVGRRARLEFKHFCRHVMMDSLVNRDELVGWRGEIRDSEVVRTHEEALEDERAEEEGYDDELDEDGLEDEDEDADLDEGDGEDDEELDEDEFVAEDEADDADEDFEADDADDADEDFEADDEGFDDELDETDDSDESEDDDRDAADDAERPARGRARRAERAHA